MKNKIKMIYRRPSPLVSIASIIGLILMLVFIFYFFTGTHATEWPGGDFASLFFAIFVLACVGGIIYHIINLKSFSTSSQKSIPITAEDVIDIADDTSEETVDFETKLRKIEALKKDGLLSEEEYQKKRNEIINQIW